MQTPHEPRTSGIGRCDGRVVSVRGRVRVVTRECETASSTSGSATASPATSAPPVTSAQSSPTMFDSTTVDRHDPRIYFDGRGDDRRVAASGPRRQSARRGRGRRGRNGHTVVVHGTTDGRLVSWMRSDGEFVPSDTAVADGLVMVFDLATFGGSAVVVGSDFGGLPRFWTSIDGTAWTDVVTTGFDEPADVVALSAPSEALYAAGVFRDGTGGPAVRPAIWRSTDGLHWEFVTPPETAANGAVSEIVAGAGSVIVAMQAEGRGSIWRSVDGAPPGRR